MGKIKDRDSMDLTEAEGIKKSGKDIQKNCKKNGLNNPDNHNGVITHLEPDILECEAKWALGSITMNIARGGNGIQLSYFKS